MVSPRPGNLNLRGGARERMSRSELEAKFARNAALGGWPEARIEVFRSLAATIFDQPIDLARYRA